MPLPVRKSYKGSPVTTSLTALLGVGSTSCTVNSVTGWPTTFPFYVVIEPSTSREEKVRVTGITGTTLTIVRAQDNTIDVEHAAASVVYPVFTAIEADEANQIASVMTTKGDLISTDGSTINRLAVGATNTHVLQVDSTQTNGIKWGQVATAGIADSAITSAKIADGTIVAGDIADGAITSAKILDGTIATADIADSAITSAKIADGTIVNADINASAAIALTKLASITAGSVLMGNASAVPTATALSGDVTVNSSGVTAIGSGVIVNADINASAAIDLSKLATGALPTAITVASANIVDGTIVTADIADSAITSAKIADGTIVNADVNASAAIALSKLATGALPSAITIASANIVDGTIATGDIADSAITNAKIAGATGSWTPARQSGTLSSSGGNYYMVGQIMYFYMYGVLSSSISDTFYVSLPSGTYSSEIYDVSGYYQRGGTYYNLKANVTSNGYVGVYLNTGSYGSYTDILNHPINSPYQGSGDTVVWRGWVRKTA